MLSFFILIHHLWMHEAFLEYWRYQLVYYFCKKKLQSCYRSFFLLVSINLLYIQDSQHFLWLLVARQFQIHYFRKQQGTLRLIAYFNNINIILQLQNSLVDNMSQKDTTKISQASVINMQQTIIESKQPSKLCIIIIVLTILGIISVGLNIYFGIINYQIKDLNIKATRIKVNQSCSIFRYEVDLKDLTGAVFQTSECQVSKLENRLLASTCYTYTKTGQCQYCTKYNEGKCIQLSNKDPYAENGSSESGNSIQFWIKCILSGFISKQWGLQSCTKTGLQQYSPSDKSEMSIGAIIGIVVGVVVFLLCCCVCCIGSFNK